MTPALSVAVLEHLLRVMGAKRLLSEHGLCIPHDETGMRSAIEAARAGAVALLMRPPSQILSEIGAQVERVIPDQWRGVYLPDNSAAFSNLRGFGPAHVYSGADLEGVVVTSNDEPIWAWRSIGQGGVLCVGADISEDAIRFKQGNPTREPRGDELEKWGYSGERPDYLFEDDLDANSPHDRAADWPVFALTDFVRKKTGASIGTTLPNGAPCAIVITGDTDGATPDHYAEQRRLLGDLPITYFLRTACAAPSETLRMLDADDRVDLQLHPDALDAPERYSGLLSEQIQFFERVIGRRPYSVRNHGYLNDGYWRHAAPWISEGVTWSANLPGVDGRVLNGSLLPGRLMLDDSALSSHWSLVTPYGDGMIFALNISDEDAAARLEAHMDEIVRSGVPGVVTINLHPANVAHTAALHEALHRLVDNNALAWSFAQCATWFEEVDTQRDHQRC